MHSNCSNVGMHPSNKTPEGYEGFSGNKSTEPSNKVPEGYEGSSGNKSTEPSNKAPEGYEGSSGNQIATSILPGDFGKELLRGYTRILV